MRIDIYEKNGVLEAILIDEGVEYRGILYENNSKKQFNFKEKFAVSQDDSGCVMKSTAMFDRHDVSREEEMDQRRWGPGEAHLSEHPYQKALDMRDNDWDWAPDDEYKAMIDSIKVYKL